MGVREKEEIKEFNKVEKERGGMRKWERERERESVFERGERGRDTKRWFAVSAIKSNWKECSK